MTNVSSSLRCVFDDGADVSKDMRVPTLARCHQKDAQLARGPLRGNLTAVASRIGAQLIERTVTVWVSCEGHIYCDSCAALEADPPGELVGIYTFGVEIQAIEEDLAFVRNELSSGAILLSDD